MKIVSLYRAVTLADTKFLVLATTEIEAARIVKEGLEKHNMLTPSARIIKRTELITSAFIPEGSDITHEGLLPLFVQPDLLNKI